MRPIKFRAWHKTARKMLTVTNISLIDGYVTSHEQIEEGNFPEGPSDLIDTYEINEIELMQFTGLKDKNGKDIYYDDIVFGGYGCGRRYTVDEIFVAHWLIYDDKMNNPTKYYEVIGNIYQPSPEPPLTEDQIVDKKIKEERDIRMVSAKACAQEIRSEK